MKGESFEFTREHIEAMEAVRGGADVPDYLGAMKLREIERKRPELVSIGPIRGKYGKGERLPYFGAILTDEGIQFLNSHEAEGAT